MRKATLLGMIFLILSGVIFLCLFTPAKAATSTTVTIAKGKNILTLTRIDEGEITETYHGEAGRLKKGVSVENLGIAIRDSSTSPWVIAPLLNLPDHCKIETNDPVTQTNDPVTQTNDPVIMRPGCTWYFWGGRWWMLCD